MAHGPGVRHYNTHAQLVEPAAVSPKRRFAQFPDAIVVPAAREASNLKHVIALARKARCALVVICSREARASEVQSMLTELSFTPALVIDLPHAYSHSLFEFATTSFGDLGTSAPRDSDLSMKRNLALVLARGLGWRRLFFMDDDIRGVKLIDLHRTVGMLDSYPVAGMRVKEFPDNSVACLANRMTGSIQDVFVSGSVLAVDCAVPLGFFPDIYNEDWLFFYEDVANGRLGRSGGFARQLEYDPFADPLRAARQEFGDLLAEGLYAFLHDHKDISKVDTDDWANFRLVRKGFLEDIKARAAAPSVRLDAETRGRIVTSVNSALECLEAITPEICTDYVQSWLSDLNEWEKRIGSLPPMKQDQALAMLGLSSHAHVLGECGGARASSHEWRRFRITGALAVGGALLALVIRSQVGLESVLRMRKPGTAGIPPVRGIGAVGDSAGSSSSDPAEAHGGNRGRAAWSAIASVRRRR
jgi:hypothetical protein